MEKLPVLTFTAPWGLGDLEWNPPSAAYVRYLAAGLLAAGAWSVDVVAAYVAACPGAAGYWTREQIRGLLHG
jgi:hypothetical protein